LENYKNSFAGPATLCTELILTIMIFACKAVYNGFWWAKGNLLGNKLLENQK